MSQQAMGVRSRPMMPEDDRMQDPKRRGAAAVSDGLTERLGRLVFLLTITFLAFVGGAMVVLSQEFPYRFLRDAYMAGEALIAQRKESLDRYGTDLWRLARSDARGVVVHDPVRAFSGYTLYTAGDDAAARLIAMDGRVLHQWRRPFSTVWNETAAVRQPQPDHLIHLAKARLLPRGELLAIYEAAGDTPWGYGMVKLDRNSEVIWSYLEQTHHDFDIAPDGRIFALTHAFVSDELPSFPVLEPPRLDDFVVVLSPEGVEIAKLSLTQALVRSRYEPLLHTIPNFSKRDPLHTNTVEYIDAEKAKRFPFGKEGDVLVSFRDMGVVAVVDLAAEQVVWAVRGPWVGQHDPSLLPDGRMLIFDNLGAFREGNNARLLEFDPVTQAVTWSYAGGPDQAFDSPLRSSAQRLPNGNTLATESDGGRLFETTREGEIVWSYLNPVRGGEGGRYIPIMSWGQRVDPLLLDADFRRQLENRMEASR